MRLYIITQAAKYGIKFKDDEITRLELALREVDEGMRKLMLDEVLTQLAASMIITFVTKTK